MKEKSLFLFLAIFSIILAINVKADNELTIIISGDTQSYINNVGDNQLNNFYISNATLCDEHCQLLIQVNNSVNNLTNITITNQNLLQQILNYLNGFLNQTINYFTMQIGNLTITVNTINATTQQLLNLTNQTRYPHQIIIVTQPCITGSNWELDASVKDQFTNPINATCNINTTFDGYNPMTYLNTTGEYNYITICPTPTVWNWTVQCN